MDKNNNNVKIIVAIIGFIVVIYFANVTIKNIKQNKDKTTIENAIKILGFYKGDFDKKQEQEFIALYRQNINTDLHKKLFKALTKLKQNSMQGGGFTELTAEEKDAIKYLYDNVIKIIKGK
jgi:hypothetical protein